MTLAGFRAQNHPQQIGKRGASAAIDDRAIRWEDFNPLHERFRFTIDAAASAPQRFVHPGNARLPRFWTIEDDALAQSWAGERVWCNPPYSDLEPWVVHAQYGNRWLRPDHNDLVVMLLPANRTEQKWWQHHIEPHRDGRSAHGPRLEFLPGRMRFDRPGAVIGPKGDRPPFGCCLAIWGHQ